MTLAYGYNKREKKSNSFRDYKNKRNSSGDNNDNINLHSEDATIDNSTEEITTPTMQTSHEYQRNKNELKPQEEYYSDADRCW